jgi:hypothetical protein
LSAGAAGASPGGGDEPGDAPNDGNRLSKAEACGSTSFEPYKDREVHHGEEDKGEETVHQKEEEGRSGPQEAENDEDVSEKVDQEEVGAQGRPEAPLGAKARGSFNARTGADALVEPAQRLRRRWRYRRLISIEQARRAAAPSAAACIA